MYAERIGVDGDAPSSGRFQGVLRYGLGLFRRLLGVQDGAGLVTTEQ